ncbi:TauD/TfdA family dioxygenase [Pseudomonas sp. TWP3-1]|uniref:TauD/TfdA family dioxygenase n=1 Tax=Pseudomonas sp. TWP3-1 TaxID=2804631 RepID=UPI003CF1FD8E
MEVRSEMQTVWVSKTVISRKMYWWRLTELPRVTAAFYPDMVIPVDDAAKNAYAKFYHALKQVAHGVDIQPGKLVYVNNRFTLHSRDRFTPGFDPNGQAWRWVQRVFLTNNLWNFRTFKKNGPRIFFPTAH